MTTFDLLVTWTGLNWTYLIEFEQIFLFLEEDNVVADDDADDERTDAAPWHDVESLKELGESHTKRTLRQSVCVSK